MPGGGRAGKRRPATPSAGRRLTQCPECQGTGAIAFDTGPAAEPCQRCAGTGWLYSGRAGRGLFGAMVIEGGALLDPKMRLLLNGLIALEERVAQLERELGRRTDEH